MFRHTTKQRALGQEQLKTRALRHVWDKNDEKCESVYHQTYDRQLPHTSLEILEPIVSGLSARGTVVSPTSRMVHTVGVWTNEQGSVMHLGYIQPEIVTCTASLRVAYATRLEDGMEATVASCNNCKPCVVLRHRSSCQVTGRMAPYLIEDCGLVREARWSHVNATGSKFVFVFTKACTTSYMTFTKASLKALEPYAQPEAELVESSDSRSFKLTCEAYRLSGDTRPNRNTCVILRNDGSFKVQGLPSETGIVCAAFRRTIMRISQSAAWGLFLGTLQDIPPEVN